ncbi:S-adenosyl-L-methionine-dependent methyltransferase [Xylaria grammica]|nr:S-adenosyl-L-methionine-dependent methyltransferase [Xylaria grammica]
MAGSQPGQEHYIFDRDHKSSIRLNYQHILIKKLCNDQLLHPAIQQSIASRSSIRVADIATGTALWLTELSDALPKNAQFHGFDISRNQYPPNEWLPNNVSLHEHDAFKPFAPEFLGTFDVVNLRFFITLLNGKNVQSLLGNLKTLLKPDGFLHWLDFDPRSARAIAIRPSLHMPRTESVVSIMRKAQHDVDLWLPRYTDLYEAAGLHATVYERVQLRDHLRPMWNHCHIMGMEELARRTSQATESSDCKQPSPLLQQIKDLEAEFAQGASIDAQWFLIIGKILDTQN